MTRRELLLALAASSSAAAKSESSRMSVEGYIFQQYAERLHRTLGEVVGDVFGMAHSAGFRNIEVGPAFFTPDIRDRVLSLLHSLDLRMPSVYVGGPMHEKEAADRTIAQALEVGKICAPFGCKAIVNNPDPKQNHESKTSAELAVEADSLNRMGRALADHGFELRVHHHTPQLENNGREWKYILGNTDDRYVYICVDCDWAYEGGFDPLAFMRGVGKRLREIHIRSAKNKIWLEDLEDSDIDYTKIAEYLKRENLQPLLVVELAYRPNTSVTRSLEEDLRISRIYAEKIFSA